MEAEERARRDFYNENQEKFRKGGPDDPFNTPFENWYNAQRRDPESPTSLLSHWMRLFLWAWLGLIVLKMLGLIRRKGDPEKDMREAYYREAERQRLNAYALQQQELY